MLRTLRDAKIQISLVVCSLVVLLFTALVMRQWPDGYLHIVVCDVGQGDAILLMQDFTQILVDAGLDEGNILQCLRENMPFWDRQIEWIAPTHFDADHIGGYSGVLERFSVVNMLLPEGDKQTADFDRFEQAVAQEQKSGSATVFPEMGMQVSVHSDWDLRVLYAPSPQKSLQIDKKLRSTEEQLWDENNAFMPKKLDSNNRSVVLSLRFHQVSLLLMGDLEKEVEQALVDRGLVGHHDLLKVGHHGSKSSSSEVFLQKVRPEVALVSVGKNNRYGHPTADVLRRLRANGVKQILRTDELGSIVLKSDGLTVWREQ